MKECLTSHLTTLWNVSWIHHNSYNLKSILSYCSSFNMGGSIPLMASHFMLFSHSANQSALNYSVNRTMDKYLLYINLSISFRFPDGCLIDNFITGLTSSSKRVRIPQYTKLHRLMSSCLDKNVLYITFFLVRGLRSYCVETLFLVRSPKLSNIDPGQYLDQQTLGINRYCKFGGAEG